MTEDTIPIPYQHSFVQPNDTLRINLLRRVRGIGVDRARRLLGAFGDGLDSALAEIGNIEAVAVAVAPDRPLLAHRLAAVLIAQWQAELAPEYEAVAWLDRYGITDQPILARKIVRILGDDTRPTLEANPYVLSKTLTWPKMDAIGRKVLATRMGPGAVERVPQRLLGAIDSAVGEWLASGHTAIPKFRMRHLLRQRLGTDDHAVMLAEDLGVRHGRITGVGDFWRFPGCAFLEAEVAARLQAMSGEPGRIAPSNSDIDRVLVGVAPLLPCPLSEEQAAAVRHVLHNPFAVIAGGAGTGKTATMANSAESAVRSRSAAE